MHYDYNYVYDFDISIRIISVFQTAILVIPRSLSQASRYCINPKWVELETNGDPRYPEIAYSLG
jgi:hypothetical protein